jgi:hypothetical protein
MTMSRAADLLRRCPTSPPLRRAGHGLEDFVTDLGADKVAGSIRPATAEAQQR